jgi:outer membrane receptor protein involved in Fe transport
LPSGYDADRTTPGAHAQWSLRRGPLDLEVGLRVDVPEEVGAELSPRLGLGYRLGDGKTRLRVSAGRAFKLPSFFALASPPQLGGNPQLRPESVVGAELGAERRWASGEASVTLFWNRYRDLVDFDFELFTHLNRARVRSQGVETTITWRPSPRWHLRAAATRQQVEDLDAPPSQDELRDRPDWTASAVASYKPAPGWQLRADLRTVSSRLDSQIPVPDRSRAAGYETVGLSSSWSPGGARGSAWRLQARVDNLTDTAYETRIGFPGTGRSWRLGARWQSGG